MKDTALLINKVDYDLIHKYYNNLPFDKIRVQSLFKHTKKTTASMMKEFYDTNIFNMSTDVKNLLITDGDYFKVITGKLKIEPYLNYVVKSKDNRFNCIYLPHYSNVFYNPEVQLNKISKAIETYNKLISGTYIDPGQSIIHSYSVLNEHTAIQNFFNECINSNCDLVVDIETYSLKHYDAGLGTITFCKDKNNGIVIPVLNEPEIKTLIKNFFIKAKNRFIYHNATFDIKCLIYSLFMENLTDIKGLLYGLEIMTSNFEDTKVIAYLATNSTNKVPLGLKSLAHEYSGNYAVEVNDITKVPLEDLCKYNLIDGLSTWWVYHKYYPIMVQDQQLDIYENLLKPSLIDLIQIELTGIPINMDRTKQVHEELLDIEKNIINDLHNNPLIKEYTQKLKEEYVDTKNSTYKKKTISIKDAEHIVFNPNSNKQLTDLLYLRLGLPVLDYTDSKAPATGGKALSKLLNETDNDNIKQLLNCLIEHKAVDKLLTAFFPSFFEAKLADDGQYYLFGSFHIGGTLSGRLSSSQPNLQQLPSTGSPYAKMIKSCFGTTNDLLFVGADSNSLEDRISALQTKDPVKLSVYIDGYDGHCLNAYAYYTEKMPIIADNLKLVTSVSERVKVINSIKTQYPDLRQSSKNITFACTYGGTYHTLSKNLGIEIDQAMNIEKRYRDLYHHSIKWADDKILEAAEKGYTTLAFGLRLRTPILKQVILGNSSTPNLAASEARTVGNALGQSWCLLNNRACVEFMRMVRKSEFKYKIRPAAQIHDALYFIIDPEIEVLHFVNTHLIKAMSWQDDPRIYHDEVKLGAELGIFFPDWSKEITLPNNLNILEIEEIIKEY